MDLLMNEVRSLQLKVDGMTKKIESLDDKINEITESQQIGGETVRESSNSVNIIIKFLACLRKLTSEELKNTLIEADTILNTVKPIPTDQNLELTQEWNVTKDKLKTVLKEVFDLLNSLPLNTSADANDPVASTSTESRYDNTKAEEERKKIQFWRRYKNKYNYIEKLKLKLPPLDDDPVEEVESLQNDENDIAQNDSNAIVQNDLDDSTQNDVNDTAQNSVNDTAQNDLNDKIYTINDIIQNVEVYEMFKSRLKNSPYDDPYFKNNVKNSNLCLTLQNGETITKPVSHVAPLIVLKKFDELNPIPLHLKQKMAKKFSSTLKKDSDKINDSNSNSTTTNVTKRETRANKTKDSTKRFNTDVKDIKKRNLTTKDSKYEPSKKRRN